MGPVSDRNQGLWTLTDAEAEAEAEAEELLGHSASPPLQYRFPPLLVLLLALFTVGYIVRALVQRRRMTQAMAEV